MKRTIAAPCTPASAIVARVARTVRWGAGWSGGGGGLETAGQMFERVRAAWREAGREGKPELRALSYFALGPEAETGRDYLVTLDMA